MGLPPRTLPSAAVAGRVVRWTRIDRSQSGIFTGAVLASAEQRHLIALNANFAELRQGILPEK